MKLKKRILIALIVFSNTLLAQHSIGFIYSGKVLGANYKSASIITLEYTPNLINERYKIGLAFSIIDATVNNNFVRHPPPLSLDETELSFGIKLKYFPLFQKKLYSPFLSIGIGNYFKKITLGISGNSCEIKYYFDLQNNYYLNLGAGILLFPQSKGHIILEAQYQFRYPKNKYKKPTCFPDYNYIEFTETVNLSMLLLRAGLQFDF